MEYIQGFIIVTLLLILYFFLGDWVGQLFRVKSGAVSSVVMGFAASLAFFELLALPFLFLRKKFSVLYVLTVILFGIVVCWSVFQFFRHKRYRFYRRPKAWGISGVLLLVLLAGILVFQAFCSSYYQHEDADDSYFITISNIALEQDLVASDDKFVTCGHHLFREGFRPEVSSWELYLAVVSKTFGVHPAALAHSYLPFLLILLCYGAYQMLSERLFEDVKQQRIFLLVIGILNLFGSVSNYSVSSFLLVRIWQGKAMLCNFLFPLAYALFAEIFYRGMKEKSRWVSLVGLGVLGMGFSASGIFLVPILLFALLASYLIYLWLEHQPGIRLVLKRTAFLLLPVAVVLFLLFLRVVCSPSGGSYITAMGEGADWLEDARKIYGIPLYQIIAAASAILLCLNWKRGKQLVFLFLGSTMILFGTFLNPLLCRHVSAYVTGVAAYWRLFWLIPVLPQGAAAIAGLWPALKSPISEGVLNVQEKKDWRPHNLWKRGLPFGIAVLLLAVLVWQSDGFIYRQGVFQKSAGVMKLRPETMAVMEYLKEQEGFQGQMLVGPEWLTCQVRQYTAQVVVPRPRGMSSFYLSLGIQGLFPYNYDTLYRDIYEAQDISSENARTGLEYLDVDYIFSPKELHTGDTPYVCVDHRQGVYIYKKQ